LRETIECLTQLAGDTAGSRWHQPPASLHLSAGTTESVVEIFVRRCPIKDSHRPSDRD